MTDSSPVLVNPPAAALGHVNAVLRGTTAREYYVRDFAGPLSIKSVVRGSGLWETPEGRFRVDESSYLILNHGQRYSLTIETDEPVETLCVFFCRGFVEDAFRSRGTRPERLLDDPKNEAACADFVERQRAHDGGVSPVLARLRAALFRGDPSAAWLEEQLHVLADGLVKLHSGIPEDIAPVPALRAATRLELHRRLHRARDYVDASLDESLPLDGVARVACLSPHHFHRLFTQVFGETPHRYVVRRRLERACGLLARTDRPVTTVCLEAGFTSLGSFSTLFRRRFGVSPREYRSQKSKIREDRREGPR